MDIHNGTILAVLVISSLLNVGYFAPIFLIAFFGNLREEDTGGSLETTPLVLLMVVPLFVTSIISVLIGIWPDPLLSITRLMGGA